MASSTGTYAHGDKVTLVRGVSTLTTTLEGDGFGTLYISDSNDTIRQMLKDGWTVTEHESAPTPLPTEPGIYQTEHSIGIFPHYTLSYGGTWTAFFTGSTKVRTEAEMRDGIDGHRLVRLVPEGAN